jgi:hypothetical protein
MMVVETFPLGFCFTCGTRTCEHVTELNKRNRAVFEQLLKDMDDVKPKLPGLTGEPWSKSNA